MNTDFYFLSHFIAAIIVFCFSFFVFLSNKKSKINLSFSIFDLVISCWLLFSAFASISTDAKTILFWFKASYATVIILPYVFLSFAFSVVGKKNRFVSFLALLHVIFFLSSLWFSDLLIEGVYHYSWGYYPRASLSLHPFFLLSFCGLFSYTIFIFICKIKDRQDDISALDRLRAIYILLGTLLGVLSSFDFIANYGIDFYPAGFIFALLYPSILTYAILKYRLLDIRVAVTRAGIFTLIYTFVLGLPLWLGIRTGFWIWATILMGILSTIGPFIYSYLRQQIENALFKEQQRYQQAIRELAKRMVQIRDLDKLFVEVVAEVYTVVQPQFIALYTFSKPEKAYILSRHHLPIEYAFVKQIPFDSQLITEFSKNKRPMFAESASTAIFPLETLLVPYFSEGRLFGFLVVGQKSTKMMYTDSDFVVFDILSSQVSLAIENCLFWQEEKTRLAKEEQIRRQRAMDHFSASLAHEIDNPVFAVTGMAEVVKETIATDLKSYIPQDKLDYLSDRLSRINHDLLRISKMIKAIREFSSQTKGEQVILNVDEVLGGFFSIVEPQFKYEGIVFEKQIETGIAIKGNKIHLEEVLVNFSTNSIHAVKYNNKKEKRIALTVRKNSPMTCLIEFKDNGYGIKQELLEDIFLDFVTTKASSEGSGIGLGRVRKIIEDHGGKVWASSQGENTGAAFFIEMPLVK